MKNCPNCGAQLDDSAKFCTNCGASFEAPKAETTENNTHSDPYYANAETVVNEPVRTSAPVAEPIYAPAAPAAPAVEAEKPVPTLLYMLFDIISAIPVVNFILMIVLAIVPNNKSIKNYWKAKIIWVIIGFVLSVIATIFVLINLENISDWLQAILDSIPSDIKSLF